MHPSIKLHLARISSVILTLSILFSAPNALSSKDQPRISWSEERIEITLSPGGAKAVNVHLISNQSLQSITLEPVPALARFLTIQPGSFASITGGQQKPVLLNFSIPVGTGIGTYDGVIHVRSGKKNLPQNLKIVIHVQEKPPTLFTLYSNPGDPLLLRAETPVGEIFEYFGTKDETGLATALTSVRIQEFNGDITQIFLDEQARPTEILAFNGVVFKIAWLSNTNILVTAISPDGSYQVNVAVDLTAQQSAAQNCPSCSLGTNAKQSTSDSPLKAARTPGAALEAVVTPPEKNAGILLNKILTLQSSALANDGASLLNVTRCGRPVSDARVSMLISPEVAPPYEVPGIKIGPGQYKVTIPSFPSSFQNVAVSCEKLTELLSAACELVGAIPLGAEFLICAAITSALLRAPSAIRNFIFAACARSFSYIRRYCFSALGYSPGMGAPSFGERLCGEISSLVDRYVNGRLILFPTVFIPGEGVVRPSPQLTPSSGPFPTFNVELVGTVKIESFTTTPEDPAPSQGYVANAFISCAPPGTFVNISVHGTDGYFDLSTVTISGDANIQLVVPGASEGIIDTVQVQVVGGPTRNIILVF